MSWLAIGVEGAHAASVFCVDTVPEFNTAIQAADEENVEIRLETGTYDLTGSCVDSASLCAIDDDVIIRGGYSANCASRDRDARTTVLTRPGGGIVFDTAGSAASGNGDLLLESLTFRNVTNGVAIAVENTLNPDATVTLRRVKMDQSGPLRIRKTSTVYLRQSAFTRLTGTCAVSIEPDSDNGGLDFLDFVQLSHVTIANNDGEGLCIGNPASGDWSMSMTSTIVWGNGGTDIRLRYEDNNPVPADWYSNTYGTRIGGLVGAESGTVQSNPQFVNPGAGNFELGGTSASINTAFPQANAVNDFDMEGEPRVFSSAADRGALESSVGSTSTTLVVTNTADSGTGSLRQAILDANQSQNLSRIHFNIGSTCGPRIFNLPSNLPAITSPVLIDGYTQPGASRNTQPSGNNRELCVILRPATGSSAFVGLQVLAGADSEAQLQVDGLVFGGFLVAGINIAGGNSHSVLGSQFGGTVGAVALTSNGYGVNVVSDTIGVQIGGPEPGDRNIFGDTVEAAISLSGSLGDFSGDAVVENNWIGLGENGLVSRPNGRGIFIAGFRNRIRGNFIASSTSHGIEISGSFANDNTVEDNVIGYPATLCFTNCNRGNDGHGIRIDDGATRNLVRNNRIGNNGGDGVAVISTVGNPIYLNAISNNTGEGIDLGNDGHSPNNPDYPLPTGAVGNYGQNFPTLNSALGGSSGGLVSGVLNSANGWYRIDIYTTNMDCTGSPAVGQGFVRVGGAQVRITNATANSDGGVGFSNVPISRAGDPTFFSEQRQLVATATRYSTDPAAGGSPRNTSEFGVCRPYVNDGRLFKDSFE